MSNGPNSIRPAATGSGGKVDAAKAAYITAARQRYTKSTYDIEITDVPNVGIAEDGAWVSAWLWVGREEAGLCEEESALCCEA